MVERAVDGREAVWGEVLAWEPPSRLVLTWHPGADADPAGTVEVFFIPDGIGTRVELVHSGWEAFSADASARRLSYDGRQAWGSVLDHLAELADHSVAEAGWGVRPRGAAGDLHALLRRGGHVVSADAAVLNAWVAEHDTRDALATAGRERSELLIGLLSRLDDREAATEVPARLAHAGAVVVDEPLLWARIVAI